MALHGEQHPSHLRLLLRGGGGASLERQLRISRRVHHARLPRSAELQPDANRRPLGLEGVRDRDSEGFQMERSDFAGYPLSSGERSNSGKHQNYKVITFGKRQTENII